MQGDYATYWKKTGGQNLSDDFKDLILKLFSYNGKDRPTVADIRAHPWMAGFDGMKQVRHDILTELAEKRINSTASSERQGDACRGEERLHLIRQKGFCDMAFDDIEAYDVLTELIKPGHIWDDLEEYIETNNLKEQWELTEAEDAADDIMDDDDASAEKQKHIRITIKPDSISGEEERDDVKGFDSQTVVEIKFFKKDDTTARVQIQATQGDISHWKQIFTKEDEGLKYQLI